MGEKTEFIEYANKLRIEGLEKDALKTQLTGAIMSVKLNPEKTQEELTILYGMLLILTVTEKITAKDAAFLYEKARKAVKFEQKTKMALDGYNRTRKINRMKFEGSADEWIEQMKDENEEDPLLKKIIETPYPHKILQNGPATVVFWKNGGKTVVKLREGDTDNIYTAFTAALAKKLYGNNTRVTKYIKKAEVTDNET